jgi:hypothetical protein
MAKTKFKQKLNDKKMDFFLCIFPAGGMPDFHYKQATKLQSFEHHLLVCLLQVQTRDDAN